MGSFNQANQELRHLFQYLVNPNPQVKFFYDLSAHYVDSVFFDDYVTDTSGFQNWMALYREMYYMAYDTTQMLKTDSLLNNISYTFGSDTVPVLLMDWDFNKLKPDALTSGTYFIFDTINDVLYDKPGAPSPYLINNVFAGAAATEIYNFNDPVFAIRPQWIFKDAAKDYTSPEMVFKINFDDGTGWHSFDDVSVQFYTAQYPSMGLKLIKFGLFAANNPNPYKFSMAAIYIASNKPRPQPDEIWYRPGMSVGVFKPDPACNLNTEEKFVIYVEGFDPMNDNSISDSYNRMILSEKIVQLKNFGYTFLVINWANSNLPIELNGDFLIQFIEHLKCRPKPNSDVHVTKTPFVIIGTSMGGLVARYALLKMESPAYYPLCKINGVQHNTRLLITIDTPHDGANIPVAYQYLYKYASLTTFAISPTAAFRFAKYHTLLDGAATQMLKYHIATDLLAPLPVSTSSIGPHPNKVAFDQLLASMGNYPRFCKIVALSNGSWTGGRQIRPWDNSVRVPHDKLLDINFQAHMRILNFNFMGATSDLTLRSLPQGQGNVFNVNNSIYHIKINLFLFGINISTQSINLISISKSVTNVQPYDVMPGSLFSDFDMNSAYTYGVNNLGGLFNFDYNAANGTLYFNKFYGIHWLGGTLLQGSAYSDGLMFGFIPTASSFDFDMQGNALDHPILQNPVDVADIMSRTPFDVVYSNPTITNRNHLHVENPELQQCQTCEEMQPYADSVHSYLINREIGDDTLWLENTLAHYPKPIEAERQLLINFRNIYYNYAGSFGIDNFNVDNFPLLYSPTSGAIVLSRKKTVEFYSPGTLRSNQPLLINPAQYPIGPFTWQQGNMTICCIDYYELESNKKEFNSFYESPPVSYADLSVFPNPAGGPFMVRFQMKTKGNIRITLTDMLGRHISQWSADFADPTSVCYFSIDKPLPDGIYIISVTNDRETYRTKVIVE